MGYPVNPHLVARSVGWCADVNAGRGVNVKAGKGGHIHARVMFSEDFDRAAGAPDAFVVVAGSNDATDWKRNLSVKSRSLPGLGDVHGGVLRVAEDLAPALIRKIREHGADSFSFIGHSQGGAVASLLAYAAWQNGKKIHSVITFGEPPIFSQVAKENYHKAEIPKQRVVVGWDAVVRHPSWMHHTGQSLFLSENGDVLNKQERPAWYKPWEYIWEAFDDHYIANEYTRAVTKWSKNAAGNV